MAGVEHHLPLIHYWDICLPLFPMLTAPVTDVEGNDPARRRVHGNPEPGLPCLLSPQLFSTSTSASSRSSIQENANAIVPQRRRECIPSPGSWLPSLRRRWALVSYGTW